MFSEITKKIEDTFRRLMNIRSVQDIDAGMVSSLLIILAITLLSFEATDLFYKIISIPLAVQTASAAPASEVAGKNPERRQLQDYAVISERNLFQTTMKVAGGAESGDIGDSDQKAMDFDLKGTVACAPSCGFIVVEERGTRKQKLYKIGNSIGSNKLVKIGRNTATLKNGEREITLKVKETVEGSLVPGPTGTARPAYSPSAAAFHRGALNNLESVMNQAVVRPFMNKGVREGYVVSNIAPGSLYEKAGLQNGDIVVSINDNQMQNANDVLQVLNSLQSGGTMRFTVKRRGKTETLNYNVE